MNKTAPCTLVVLALSIAISGCMTADQHQQTLGSSKERELTAGVVQKEIRVGMSQADVATALGSPNIVTKNSEGKDTWIYDKIATEVSYSRSQENLVNPVAVLLVGTRSVQTGAANSSQKTLTIVIKFDSKSNVESFTYHASKF